VTVAVASIVLAVPMAIPASAMPAPNNEEWWFDSFAIETKVWPQAKGSGVTVALIDSGVNASLPELRGVVLPGTNVVGGSDDGRIDSDTDQGHGTAMANLIAAQGGGTAGWLGIAPGAKILPIGDRGGMSSPSLSQGIRYAADHGAKVLNISQSAPATADDVNNCPSNVQDAVAYAVKHDVVILAAAGNDGDSGNMAEYPAGCPGVIAVGAYDHLGNAWKSTQRQDYVSIGGPGVGVGSIGGDGRLYHNGEGTSQATALSSGAVALIRSKFPHESAKQIVQRIFATLTDVGPPGKDNQTGYGGININRAMTRSVPSNAPNPVYDRLDKALAAQAKNPSSKSTPATSSKKSSSNSSMLLLVGGVIVLVAIVIVIFLISRSRRRPSQPRGQAPFSSAYGQHPQEGPPPSFGPPRNQGPPPGDAFRPPPNEGPPPERRQ
jgi:type VII secretion-associated serine protease mycosin